MQHAGKVSNLRVVMSTCLTPKDRRQKPSQGVGGFTRLGRENGPEAAILGAVLPTEAGCVPGNSVSRILGGRRNCTAVLLYNGTPVMLDLVIPDRNRCRRWIHCSVRALVVMLEPSASCEVIVPEAVHARDRPPPSFFGSKIAQRLHAGVVEGSAVGLPIVRSPGTPMRTDLRIDTGDAAAISA